MRTEEGDFTPNRDCCARMFSVRRPLRPLFLPISVRSLSSRSITASIRRMVFRTICRHSLGLAERTDRASDALILASACCVSSDSSFMCRE